MFDDSVYIQNISSYQLEWKIVFFCFELIWSTYLGG